MITTVKKEETSMGVWTFDMVGDGEDEADQVLSPELIVGSEPAVGIQIPMVGYITVTVPDGEGNLCLALQQVRL